MINTYVPKLGLVHSYWWILIFQALDTALVDVVSMTTDIWLGPLSGVTEYMTEIKKKFLNRQIKKKDKIYLQCSPLFAPHRVGTGLPPVTKKKSVLHWPLKSGGLNVNVSRSTRI